MKGRNLSTRSFFFLLLLKFIKLIISQWIFVCLLTCLLAGRTHTRTHAHTHTHTHPLLIAPRHWAVSHDKHKLSEEQVIQVLSGPSRRVIKFKIAITRKSNPGESRVPGVMRNEWGEEGEEEGEEEVEEEVKRWGENLAWLVEKRAVVFLLHFPLSLSLPCSFDLLCNFLFLYLKKIIYISVVRVTLVKEI